MSLTINLTFSCRGFAMKGLMLRKAKSGGVRSELSVMIMLD